MVDAGGEGGVVVPGAGQAWARAVPAVVKIVFKKYLDEAKDHRRT